jgi:molybdenum cofactor cytidylyltransferase/nicotine blue oxidoreductase
VTTVTGVLLAAGAGTRMGQPKAELIVDGMRLVDRAVRAMSSCAAVVAVVRPGLSVDGARTVLNPDPGRGMRSSLYLGIDASTEADAIAVMLVDLPGIGATAVGAVVAGWRPDRIAMGSIGGRRTHPTVMSRADWLAALALAGPDEGARAYLGVHADRVDEFAINGDPRDLDRPADLDAWRRAGQASADRAGGGH